MISHWIQTNFFCPSASQHVSSNGSFEELITKKMIQGVIAYILGIGRKQYTGRSHRKMKTSRTCSVCSAPVNLLLCSLLLITDACDDLQCNVDYISTLTCKVYKEKKTSVSLHLRATWFFIDLVDEEDFENSSCDLTQLSNQHEYSCHLGMNLVGADDTFNISIDKMVHGQNISSECGPFFFRDTMCPTAPFNLTVYLDEKYVNFSWRTDYESEEHIYLHNELAYELSYKKQKQSWKDHMCIQILEDDKKVSLLKAQFDGNVDYVARIRAKPRNTSNYDGFWSEWSPSVTWRNQADDNFWHSLEMKILLGLGALFALILMSMPLRLPQKLWKNMYGLVPNPAPFFKPLYVRHNGDFKSWLGSSHSERGFRFESGVVLPEFLETYSQTLYRYASRLSLYGRENHEKLLPETCCSIHSHHCLKGRVSRYATGQSLEQARIDSILVTSEGDLCCPHCISTSTATTNVQEDTEEISSDDGYPPVSMDTSDENLSNDTMANQPNKEVPKTSEEHGGSPLEIRMRCNVNILDLISIPGEEWQQQDLISPDDENVFYTTEHFDSFFPSSGNSDEFRFPEICVDMDTIDSGFADSECGSPVESEFGNNELSPKAPSPESYHQGEEVCRTNYVKQWVPPNVTGVITHDKD
uniref:Interleukin-21 receptor n=2 Tax=Leptobrachium leishanense TaxID=445787 RepID=A0A8C5WJ27_9ANUR